MTIITEFKNFKKCQMTSLVKISYYGTEYIVYCA